MEESWIYILDGESDTLLEKIQPHISIQATFSFGVAFFIFLKSKDVFFENLDLEIEGKTIPSIVFRSIGKRVGLAVTYQTIPNMQKSPIFSLENSDFLHLSEIPEA